MKGGTDQSVAHSEQDVQRFLEEMWRKANIPLRKHEIVRLTELEIPAPRIWRVDCIERTPNCRFEYCVIVFEDAANMLQIAFEKKKE